MAYTSNLLAGIAGHLEDAGVCAWSPAGTYTPGQVGAYIGVIPATPDLIVTLSAYPVDIDGLGGTTQGLQVRTRGTTDPRTCLDLADAAYDALDGLSHVTLSGVHIAQIFHRSGAVLGVDSNERHEHTDTYYIQASRPSTHR